MLVVITLGADGCYAVGPTGQLRLPGHAVEVVDTVGAGDTFTGALLFHLTSRGAASRAAMREIHRDDLADALRFANAAAALTCTRAGADPPRPADVEDLLR